jgi:putrescine aminotransferase
VAAATLGGMKPRHEQTVRLPDVVHVDQPYWFGSDRRRTPGEFGLAVARQIEAVINDIGADSVAAFIGEPVQGAGGVIIPPDTYWPEVQRICDEYGILLISDEVITGFGRLGAWFGADYFGTRPDFMTFAKGVTSGYLPLGGVFVSDRVSDVLIDKGGEFFHGYTYSGHPAACAVAIENLRILKEEKLIERVRDDIGPYLQSKWATLAEHPLVGEARMVGLMGAIEIVKSKESMERFPQKQGVGMKCRDFLVTNGVVLRAVGDTIIGAPPFILSHAEADELVDKAWLGLELTRKAVAD